MSKQVQSTTTNLFKIVKVKLYVNGSTTTKKTCTVQNKIVQHTNHITINTQVYCSIRTSSKCSSHQDGQKDKQQAGSVPFQSGLAQSQHLHTYRNKSTIISIPALANSPPTTDMDMMPIILEQTCTQVFCYQETFYTNDCTILMLHPCELLVQLSSTYPLPVKIHNRPKYTCKLVVAFNTLETY